MENRESIVRKVTLYVNRVFAGDWKKAFDGYAPSGKFSASAMADLFAAAGVGYALSRPLIAQQVMAFMDGDGDGCLTWEEFNQIAHMQKTGSPTLFKGEIMAATIQDAIDLAKKIKDDILAGQPLTAWEDTLAIQQFLIDTGRGFGFKGTAEDAQHAATLKCCLEECIAATPPTSATPESTAIGDGQILKQLISLLITFLPMILK